MRKTHGDSSSINEEIATNIGFYYHSVTEHINALAIQAGDPNLVPHIARRLAALLETEALRTESRNSELVPQVWANGRATGRPGNLSAYVGQPGEALHVRSRDNGTLNGRRRRRAPLSAESIAKIAAAQRARWRKWHKKREARRVKGSERYEAQRAAALNKKRKKIRRPTNTAQSQRAYWAQFTPEERSAMMAARRQAAAENRKGK